MRSFAREFLPLVFILLVVVALAYFPYRRNQNSISANQRALVVEHRLNEIQRKNELNSCKLNLILRDFVETAAHARSTSSSEADNPKIKKLNHQVAQTYKSVLNRLKKLPPFDCKTLTK